MVAHLIASSKYETGRAGRGKAMTFRGNACCVLPQFKHTTKPSIFLQWRINQLLVIDQRGSSGDGDEDEEEGRRRGRGGAVSVYERLST